MADIWLETLPKQCPPDSASKYNGKLYRLVDNIPPMLIDFASNHALFPGKVFSNIDECTQRACSVYDSEDECKKQKKYTRLKSKKMIAISFEDNFGLVKNTFSPSHFSWWVMRSFNPSSCRFEVVND